MIMQLQSGGREPHHPEFDVNLLGQVSGEYSQFKQTLTSKENFMDYYIG